MPGVVFSAGANGRTARGPKSITSKIISDKLHIRQFVRGNLPFGIMLNNTEASKNRFAAREPVKESRLINRLRAGDEAAFELVVHEHGSHLLATAKRFCPSPQDAADAVQDAFVSVFRSIEGFEADSKLSTWLHQIVVNACLMNLRSRRRHATRSLDDCLAESNADCRYPRPIFASAEPVHSNMKAETREQVRSAIDKIPETYRQILLLRDISEFSTQETADILNISLSNVKTRLHRARQMLKNRLEPLFVAGQFEPEIYRH